MPLQLLAVFKVAKFVLVLDSNSLVQMLYDALNIVSEDEVSKQDFVRWLRSDLDVKNYAEHIEKRLVLAKGPVTRREAWATLTSEEYLPVEEYATLVAIAPNLKLPSKWEEDELTLQRFLSR